MYQAKEEGKNNFQFYSEKLNANSLERLTLESSLRHALEHHEFRLHYQAKRDMASGQITGMEALLRWQHPDLGIVAPMQFIPVAEETGLIVPIGKWVLQTACSQNVAWQKPGPAAFEYCGQPDGAAVLRRASDARHCRHSRSQPEWMRACWRSRSTRDC